ncbi:hypothetical protein ACWDF9_08650 [Streptomyces rubiginosohelvolus]
MPKLPKSISISDLKEKNDASKAARAKEKNGSASNGQQKKGR